MEAVPSRIAAAPAGRASGGRAALAIGVLLASAGLGAGGADLLRIGLSAGGDGTVVLAVLLGIWAVALCLGGAVTAGLILAGGSRASEVAGDAWGPAPRAGSRRSTA